MGRSYGERNEGTVVPTEAQRAKVFPSGDLELLLADFQTLSNIIYKLTDHSFYSIMATWGSGTFTSQSSDDSGYMSSDPWLSVSLQMTLRTELTPELVFTSASTELCERQNRR